MRQRKQRPPTDRQQEVFDFMVAFFVENHQTPPAHVIAKHFGFSSATASWGHIQALARKGLIERNTLGNWKFVHAAVVPTREGVEA